MTMNVEILRTYCLSRPGVTESFPFDEVTLVFKVVNKMFALIPLEKGKQVSLKCDPERAIALREEWEEVIGAWHMSKKHWNSVMLDGRLPDQLVFDLVDHSYDLVKKGLKKTDREALENLT